MKSEGFNGVQEISCFFEAQLLKAVIDKFAHLLLADGDAETFFSIRAFIKEAERFGNGIVENQAPGVVMTRPCPGMSTLMKSWICTWFSA